MSSSFFRIYVQFFVKLPMMSFRQIYLDSYKAHTVEDTVALIQAARAKRQSIIREETKQARQIYDAWQWRDEQGAPINRPLDQTFLNKIQVYRDVPAWLSYGLGLGYKSQDITLEYLLDDSTNNVFGRLLKKGLGIYVSTHIRHDFNQFQRRLAELRKQHLQAQDAYKSITRSEQELLLYDNATVSVESLRIEFAAHPYLDPVVYIHIGGINDGFALGRQFSLDEQQKIQARVRLANAFGSALEQNLRTIFASPNVDYAESLRNRMRTTRIGRYAEQELEAYGTELLFSEIDENTPQGGTYEDGKIIINLRKRKNPTPDLVDGDLEEASYTAVHETRHSQQHREFPELFSEDLDTVDQYVAMKLMEADAYAVGDVFNAERSHQSLFAGPPQQTPEDIAGSHLFPLDDNYIHTELGLEDHRSSASRDWSPFQLTFLEKISARFQDPSVWNIYEEQISTKPDITELIKSGEFDRRVAASPFLQPEFLKRFCVTPDGNSYLTSDPEPMFGLIRQWVGTLHNPYLAGLRPAASAIELTVPVTPAPSP